MTNRKIIEITDILSDCQYELESMIKDEKYKGFKGGAKKTLADVRSKRTELFNLISKSE